jgi:hypothetical protein
MNPIAMDIPLLARNAGAWEGIYRHVAPDLTLLDRHRFRIEVELPENESFHYRQTSHYWWDDGRSQNFVFEAKCRNARLEWDTGRIKGELAQLDDMTLYLRFGFRAQPEIEVFEMIQLSPDGRDRARSWHWLRAGKLYQLTLVEEQRMR